MNNIRVKEEKCTGCGYCVKVCPLNCISLEPSDKIRTYAKGKVSYPSIAVIDEQACNLCKACVQACSKLREGAQDKNVFNAIEIAERQSPLKDISAHKGVWCFAEELHGGLSPTVYELLYIGRKLADDLNEPMSAVLMGCGVERFIEDLISRGADNVYVCDNPGLENFIDDVHAKCLADLIIKHKPNKFLLPATTIGRSLAAKAAIIADTGLTADATGVVIDKEKGLLQVTRPTFGGNLMATILCEKHRPQMATVRPRTFDEAPKTGRKPVDGQVVEVPLPEIKTNLRLKLLNLIPGTEEIDLTDADIIVSGGRGLGKPEGFALIKELADALGGVVGASRAAVDAGWISYAHQVGQTGKTVKPKLYVACGISGAIQHLAGMGTSDVIVAVNKDASAPILKVANYGLVGDLYEVIPALIKQIKGI